MLEGKELRSRDLTRKSFKKVLCSSLFEVQMHTYAQIRASSSTKIPVYSTLKVHEPLVSRLKYSTQGFLSALHGNLSFFSFFFN